jgi:hypothetical protein
MLEDDVEAFYAIELGRTINPERGINDSLPSM